MLMAGIISLYSGPRLLMLEGIVMAAPLWPSRRARRVEVR